MDKILFYYLCAINLLCFIMMGIDKHKATNHKWRIPEFWLMFLAIIGGSFGGIMAIGIFHHKTKHKKFYVGMPIIFLIELAAILLYIYFR